MDILRIMILIFAIMCIITHVRLMWDKYHGIKVNGVDFIIVTIELAIAAYFIK